MEWPTVRNIVQAPHMGLTFHVMAYRQLDPNEALGVVRTFLAGQKKRPKKNQVVTIMTVLS